MAQLLVPPILRPPSAIRALCRFIGFSVVLAVAVLTACRSPQDRQAREMADEAQLKQRLSALTRQEEVLSAEISLAKSRSPYLAVDLGERRIELKIRGRSLRSFPISRISGSSGSAFVAKTWAGIDVRPLQPAVRNRVVPGSGEAASAAMATREPWGPKRMPHDFDLVCEEDLALRVRALPSAQSHAGVTRWFVGGYRRAKDWARDTLGRGKSNYRETIEIWLAEEDARLLFWSMPGKFKILLINGS